MSETEQQDQWPQVEAAQRRMIEKLLRGKPVVYAGGDHTTLWDAMKEISIRTPLGKDTTLLQAVTADVIEAQRQGEFTYSSKEIVDHFKAAYLRHCEKSPETQPYRAA